MSKSIYRRLLNVFSNHKSNSFRLSMVTSSPLLTNRLCFNRDPSKGGGGESDGCDH